MTLQQRFPNEPIPRHLKLLALGAACALALCLPAFGLIQSPTCYYSSSDLQQAKPPGNGWTAVPDGGTVNITIQAGKDYWFATANSYNASLKKTYTLTLKGDLGSLGVFNLKSDVNSTRGYYIDSNGNTDNSATAQTSSDSSITNESGGFTTMKLFYTFDPQPDWEVVRVKNNGLNDRTITNVTATSMCWHGNISMFTNFVVNGYINLQSCTFSCTNFYCFPNDVSVNPYVSPSFTTPGGSWSYEYVYTDPEGNPQPLGGIHWTTTGSPLLAGPENEFNMQFTVAGSPLTSYTCFAYDDDSGEYKELHIDNRPLGGTLLLDDTWADSNRTNQNLPTESAWFAANSGTLTAAPDGGSMIGTVAPTSASQWQTYFTPPENPVILNVGDMIKLTMVFTPSNVASGTPPTSRGLRLGLFNFSDGGTRVASDTFSTMGGNGTNVKGYLDNVNFVQTFTAAPFQIFKRTGVENTNLMGNNTNVYTSLGSGGGSAGLPGFTNGTQYTFEYTVTRTATDTVVVSNRFFGLNLDISYSVTDSGGANYTFDCFALRPARADSSAGSFTIQQLKVEGPRGFAAKLPFVFSTADTLGPLDLTTSTVFNTDPDTGGSDYGPGRTLFVYTADTNFPGGFKVRVFDFDSINIQPSGSITATGPGPLILVSSNTIIMNGTVNVSGSTGEPNSEGGGGGGGGGGAVALFANGIIQIGTSGQVIGLGGDGGDGQATTGSGAGGIAAVGGGSGGQGGMNGGGGNGGWGGQGGGWGAFGGGGGGGGGAFSGLNGAGRASDGKSGNNGSAGQGAQHVNGGNGGRGGNWGWGHGGSGGSHGVGDANNANNDRNGGNGKGGDNCCGGGGGGGGGTHYGGGGNGGTGGRCGGGGGGGGGGADGEPGHPNSFGGGGQGGNGYGGGASGSGGSNGEPLFVTAPAFDNETGIGFGYMLDETGTANGGGGGGGCLVLGSLSYVQVQGYVSLGGGYAGGVPGLQGQLMVYASTTNGLNTGQIDAELIVTNGVTQQNWLMTGGGGGGGGGGSGTEAVLDPNLIPIMSSCAILSGTNMVVLGTNGPPEAMYRVLSTTNLTAPMSNWTQLTTNVFELDGNFTNTFLLETNKPWQFYRMEIIF
jgi:hypothetical protein